MSLVQIIQTNRLDNWLVSKKILYLKRDKYIFRRWRERKRKCWMQKM